MKEGTWIAGQDGLPALPERSHFLKTICAGTAPATQTKGCKTWYQTELTKVGKKMLSSIVLGALL